ncbi:MAG TPA: hypothetical protein PKD54_05055 [Pirellulaceae bacterium]|nr:hypothetical protein [Pirellulaceae bacterium]
MNQQNVTVQRVAWSDLFPFAILLRTLPLAASFSVWSLAWIGVLLSPVGWFLLKLVFIANDDFKTNPELIASVQNQTSPFRGVLDADGPLRFGLDVQIGNRISLGPLAAFQKVTEPFWRWFEWHSSWRHAAFWMLGGVWTLVVWSFIGCAIVRTCLVRLARDEHLGIDEAAEFAFNKFTTALTALAVPLFAVTLLAVPGWFAGWVMRADIGLALVSVGWVFVLVLSAGMVALLAGWLLGWPLILAGLSADKVKAIDSMTRVYAFIFQKPINYAFYILLAVLFSGVCWQVVSVLATNTVQLAYWSTSWSHGDSPENHRAVVASGSQGDELLDSLQPSPWVVFGGNAIRFWNGAILSLAVAFLYGHCWALAAAIFLLMRRDVDQVEFDEMFMPEDELSYPLPPLVTDERGIPTIQPLNDGPNDTHES